MTSEEGPSTDPPAPAPDQGEVPQERRWVKKVAMVAGVLVPFAITLVVLAHSNTVCADRYGNCYTPPPPPTYQPAAPGAPAWRGWPGAPAAGRLAPAVRARLPVMGSGVALATSPDGSRLLASDGGPAKEWTLGSGAPAALPSLPAIAAVNFFPGDQPFTIAISPDLSTLAAACTSEVGVQAASGKDLDDFAVNLGTPAGPYAFGFSPDGRWLAFGDNSGAVHLVNVASGQAYVLRVADQGASSGGLDGVASVAFTPDGGTLAVGTGFGDIDLYSVATRSRLATLYDPQDGASALGSPVTALTFGEDGGLLAAGTSDGNVYLWNVAARRGLGALPGSPARTITTTYHVAFSPDGGLMAASFSDGTVRVWSAATGARLAVLSGGDELDDDPIAFGPGGNLLVNVDDSNRITEWKLR